MRKPLLLAVGVYALGNAGYIWVATGHWYATVPGVAATGPLNIHFARDVGLVFLSSGLALLWAGHRGDRSAALCGASWLGLHALYHIWIWVARGVPADLVALTNLLGIQLPALAALWAALAMTRMEPGQ